MVLINLLITYMRSYLITYGIFIACVYVYTLVTSSYQQFGIQLWDSIVRTQASGQNKMPYLGPNKMATPDKILENKIKSYS